MAAGGHRLRVLLERLAELNLDAALICTAPNMRYLLGVRLEAYERFSALLACGNGVARIIVPRLDEGKVSGLGLDYVTYGDYESPAKALSGALMGCGAIKRMGIEGAAPIRNLWLLRRVLGPFEEYPIDDILYSMRVVKDEEELLNIRQAVKAIEAALRSVPLYAKPGVSEIELADAVAREIRRAGATPQDILVQFGPNSAIPHHMPGDRRLSDNDVVLVDATATYSDYYGDLTRTYVVGSIDGFWTIYNLVKRAHDEAIAHVRAGIPASYIDEVARGVIKEGGYGEFFIHRTGHGIGLEVHEEPYVSSGYDRPIADGSVFTIEPGIYIPGRFGVRLESDVAVRGSSVEVLDAYWPY